MSNVALDIGGRHYTIACAAGEERHIEMLGRMIDHKLSIMPNMSSQTEQRTLLFAALLLADELHEAQKAPEPAPAPAPEPGPDMAGPLEMLAERLESLASRLEGSAATS